MNNTQSTHSKQFVSPPLEPILTTKSFIFLGLNLSTLGIYGAAETLSKKYRIRELKVIQEDLRHQSDIIINSWSDLEKHILSVFDRCHQDKIEEEEEEEEIKELKVKVQQLQEESIGKNFEREIGLSEIALGTMTFVGQLIANILSLGLYGVYQNYTLKNRMTLLNAQNQHIQKIFEGKKEEKIKALEKLIEALNSYTAAKKLMKEIQETDVGKAHMQAVKANDDLAYLRKEHDHLQKECVDLKIKKSIVEQDKLEVEKKIGEKKEEVVRLNKCISDLRTKELGLRQERDHLKNENQKKEDLLTVKKQEVEHLNIFLNQANQKAGKVDALQKEIDKLHAVQKNQPEVIKLQFQLGPIAPKYIPRSQDKYSEPFEELEFSSDYQKRYGSFYSVEEIVKASFEYAFNQLLEMANAKNHKINFNQSARAIGTAVELVVYRYMIFDLIQGGKIVKNGCQGGFTLHINQTVAMLPSMPENVLRYKDDQKGGFKPEVIVHYRQHDGFTPNEEVMGLKHGVNAPAVKWILEQLKNEEKGYLLTHLMAPLIENDHKDYQAMLAFMKNHDNPRVKLVKMASELIHDLGGAIQKQFSKNVLIPCWLENANDWDLKPFVKPEDDLDAINKIKDQGIPPATLEGKFVEWEIDSDVLGDKRENDSKLRQQDFYEMIVLVRKKYKTFHENLTKDLMQNPQQKSKKFQKISWEIINKQYHCSHQMIGSDFEGNGGERCLFSNLLAILAINKSALTSENVAKLKNAMAAYLDKLQKASNQWNLEKNKPSHLQSKNVLRLKELAELFKIFQEGIKKTHFCEVRSYQKWLRNETGGASIDLNNLTQFEIQLAAYTFGVRIGILPTNLSCLTTVDHCGRIIPEAEFYGPSTKEFFLMGAISSDGLGGTYYGLFPKLNLDKNINMNKEVFEDFWDLETYWRSIQLK